jgi:hypothetical protein
MGNLPEQSSNNFYRPPAITPIDLRLASTSVTVRTPDLAHSRHHMHRKKVGFRAVGIPRVSTASLREQQEGDAEGKALGARRNDAR